VGRVLGASLGRCGGAGEKAFVWVGWVWTNYPASTLQAFGQLMLGRSSGVEPS
jgi:hypothetical protein